MLVTLRCCKTPLTFQRHGWLPNTSRVQPPTQTYYEHAAPWWWSHKKPHVPSRPFEAQPISVHLHMIELCWLSMPQLGKGTYARPRPVKNSRLALRLLHICFIPCCRLQGCFMQATSYFILWHNMLTNRVYVYLLFSRSLIGCACILLDHSHTNGASCDQFRFANAFCCCLL